MSQRILSSEDKRSIAGISENNLKNSKNISAGKTAHARPAERGEGRGAVHPSVWMRCLM